MSYFIFLKNLDNIQGTIYRIAENQSDLNNLNIRQSDYKIIEDSQENFNAVKFGKKLPIKYNLDVISYETLEYSFNKNELQDFIKNYKSFIKQFTDNNSSHLLFNRWNSYYNQLNNLNLDSIVYPFNNSLEQYFNNLGQPSFNILQLP